MTKYTKEQLEEMSDREINALVAGDDFYCDGESDGSEVVINEGFDTVDYCNNWGDMGPLIKGSRISIVSASDRDWETMR